MSDQENENREEELKETEQDEERSSGEVTLANLSAEELKELLDKLRELEAVKENMLRTAADFENAKKRLVREKEDYVKFAKESLLRDLLSILDNFERALDHADLEKPESLRAVVQGIQMVSKQLAEILKGQGLKRLETKGQKFDPHRHEAIAYVEEAGVEDEIVDEIEPGYMLHDRLLRAAKVRVRKSPAGQTGETQEEV